MSFHSMVAAVTIALSVVAERAFAASCTFSDGEWRIQNDTVAAIPVIAPQWVPLAPCEWMLEDWVHVEDVLCANTSVTFIGGIQMQHVSYTFLNEFLECYSSMDTLAPNTASRVAACNMVAALEPRSEIPPQHIDVVRDWGNCAATFHFRWAPSPDAIAELADFEVLLGASDSFVWIGLAEEALASITNIAAQEAALLDQLSDATSRLVDSVRRARDPRRMLLTTAVQRSSMDNVNLLRAVTPHNNLIASTNDRLASLWRAAGFEVQRSDRFTSTWPHALINATTNARLAPALTMILLQEAFSYFAATLGESGTTAAACSPGASETVASAVLSTLGAVGTRINAAAAACAALAPP